MLRIVTIGVEENVYRKLIFHLPKLLNKEHPTHTRTRAHTHTNTHTQTPTQQKLKQKCIAVGESFDLNESRHLDLVRAFCATIKRPFRTRFYLTIDWCHDEVQRYREKCFLLLNTSIDGV